MEQRIFEAVFKNEIIEHRKGVIKPTIRPGGVEEALNLLSDFEKSVVIRRLIEGKTYLVIAREHQQTSARIGNVLRHIMRELRGQVQFLNLMVQELYDRHQYVIQNIHKIDAKELDLEADLNMPHKIAHRLLKLRITTLDDMLKYPMDILVSGKAGIGLGTRTHIAICLKDTQRKDCTGWVNKLRRLRGI
jgi:hypothetical protein